MRTLPVSSRSRRPRPRRETCSARCRVATASGPSLTYLGCIGTEEGPPQVHTLRSELRETGGRSGARSVHYVEAAGVRFSAVQAKVAGVESTLASDERTKAERGGPDDSFKRQSLCISWNKRGHANCLKRPAIEDEQEPSPFPPAYLLAQGRSTSLVATCPVSAAVLRETVVGTSIIYLRSPFEILIDY